MSAEDIAGDTPEMTGEKEKEVRARQTTMDSDLMLRGTFGDTSHARARALWDLLSTRVGERHVVAIQDFPDPDAISSGLAYRELVRSSGISADIVYEGLISHPENLALVNLLGIDLIRYTEGLALASYDAAVFIDNQGTTTRLAERLKRAGVPTFAVIDHHDPQDQLDPIFSDVRPVGAAATIFAEYLDSGVFLTLDRMNYHHVNLATALLHGLHTETNSFIEADPLDFAAAAYLSEYYDRDLLERVLCIQKSHGTMDTIHAALGRRIIRGGLSLAGVGYVRWSDRDAIPQAADFLLKEESVNTAIVFGIVTRNDDRQSIIGSLRTNSATLSVDGFLKQALGKDRTGRYYGGGRAWAGGFEIDLDFLADGGADPREKEAKWALYEGQVRRRIFEAAGLGRSDSEVESG